MKLVFKFEVSKFFRMWKVLPPIQKQIFKKLFFSASLVFRNKSLFKTELGLSKGLIRGKMPLKLFTKAKDE